MREMLCTCLNVNKYLISSVNLGQNGGGGGGGGGVGGGGGGGDFGLDFIKTH